MLNKINKDTEFNADSFRQPLENLTGLPNMAYNSSAFATFERLKRISDFLANFDFSYVQSLYREINKNVYKHILMCYNTIYN